MSGEQCTLVPFEVLAAKWASDIDGTARTVRMFPHEVVEMVAQVVSEGTGREWDGPI